MFQAIFQKIVHPAYATVCNPLLPDCNQVENSKTYFNSVLQTVFSIFFIVGVLYFLWHFVFAGYHMIATQGDPKNFESAKNEIVYGFVGLIVMFAVFAVLKVVGMITGINGLETLTIQWPSL